MIFVRYIGNKNELRETIFKVAQFNPREESGKFGSYYKTIAIVIPLYDKDWKTFLKDSYIGYGKVNHKKIYTLDVDDLELVHETEYLSQLIVILS